MPNTHTTLTSLFSDIADAIRAKTGGTADIAADEFPNAIGDIETGITPTGRKSITDTTVNDVSAYAEAQVVDANLVAANIKKDVNILGVTGTLEGGSGNILHEKGTLVFHSGSKTNSLSIQLQSANYNNFFLRLNAKNIWKQVGGVWVEQDGIDLADVTLSTGNLMLLSAMLQYPMQSVSWINSSSSSGTGTTRAYTAAISSNTATTVSHRSDTAQVTRYLSTNKISVLHGLPDLCNATWGMTYDYEVVGWNNA